MPEGIPIIARIKGASANNDREINNHDRYASVSEEDSTNKEPSIILNFEIEYIDLDNNMSANDIVKENFGEISTTTNDTSDIDKKEDKITKVNEHVNNEENTDTNEESNIPLY